MDTMLKELGFEEKEAKVYLSLLEIGESTAARNAQHAGLDRVLTYQILKRLLAKGVVSVVRKNDIQHFTAADPSVLLSQLQEREQKFKDALPKLLALKNSNLVDTSVDVYRGKEGIATILRMMARDAKPYFILGGAQEASVNFTAEGMQFLRTMNKRGVKGRLLVRKSDEIILGKHELFRYVPDHAISSTTMWVWGSKTCIFVWSKPYYAILIDNKEIAEGNLATFNYLWSMATAPKKIKKKSFR